MGRTWAGRADGGERGWPRRVPTLPLALALGAAQLVGTFWAAKNQPDRAALDWPAYALLLVAPVALLFSRRHPVPALLATIAAAVTYLGLGYPYGPVFFGVAIAIVITVTAGRRGAAWVIAGAGYVAYVVVSLFDPEPPSLTQDIVLGVWLAAILVLADVARVRRERGMASRRARQEEERRRASEERLRIARELHDVLAHNISLINVQAGVALHLMDQQPDQVRSALMAIKQASKDALGEMRGVLDALRQDDESAPRHPAPSLSDLDDLVAGVPAAGLRVSTEIEGEPKPLPSGVDRAAYRIVQEALTNVRRHSGAGTATVRLDYRGADLSVQVDDDGQPGSTGGDPSAVDGASGESSGGGNGIPGMKERAAALGGRLEAGPRADGGFRVHALLPLGGTAADGATSNGVTSSGTRPDGVASDGTSPGGVASDGTRPGGVASDGAP